MTHRPRPLPICLLVALLAAVWCAGGCGVSRKWYIAKGQPLHSELPGVGAVDVTFLKQQTDFVHVILTLHNATTSTLCFRPVGGAEAWGMNLHPLIDGLAVRPNARSEVGMVIPPGGSAQLQAQWFVSPAAESNDWRWEITFDGLMSGEQLLPQQRVAMPGWTHPPVPESSR